MGYVPRTSAAFEVSDDDVTWHCLKGEIELAEEDAERNGISLAYLHTRLRQEFQRAHTLNLNQTWNRPAPQALIDSTRLEIAMQIAPAPKEVPSLRIYQEPVLQETEQPHHAFGDRHSEEAPIVIAI